MAARQMRLTGKPVGLLVWRGAHAWVMSGFKATADPAYTDDFDVTAVWIEDPWHGRVSRTWGKGLEPHTLVSAKELGADFVKWSSRYRPEYGRDGAFVIVAPVEDASVEVSPTPRRLAATACSAEPAASTGPGDAARGSRARPPGPVARATLCACASRPGTSTP